MSGYGGGRAGVQWGVVALGAAYFLSQFYRSFLAVLYPALERDIGVDAQALSDAAGAWFLTFALAQFPIGWALDRLGPRRTAAWLLGLGGGGGAGLFAIASSPGEIIVAMGLIGVGCAPVLMANLYIFAREFEPARFATYSSLVVGLGTLGNVLASEPLARAVEAFGWRGAAIGLALGTVAVALACAALVRDPAPLEAGPAADGSAAPLRRRGLWDVLKIRALWLIFPLMALNYVAAATLRGSWSGPYLSEVYGWGAGEIGRATLWMALAMAAGAIAYGPMDRLLGSRKLVAIGGSLVVVGLCAALALAPDGPPERTVLMLAALGFFGMSYSVVMAHGRAFLPPDLIGRGVTLLNFFSIAGVGLAQVVSARVVTAAGGAEAGAPAFAALFWFYAAALTAALAVYLLSRDARP